MSLKTPDQIRTLQRKLYLKAKAEPEFRFYRVWLTLGEAVSNRQNTLHPCHLPCQ